MYTLWERPCKGRVSLTPRQESNYTQNESTEAIRPDTPFRLLLHRRRFSFAAVIVFTVMALGWLRPVSHGQVINFPSGFAGSSSQVWLENFASLDGSLIHLVPGSTHNASNAWFKTPENVQAFSTTFTFHIDCTANPSDCGGGFGFMMICACTGGNPVYDPPGKPGYTYSGYSGAQFSWSQCAQPLTPASQYCFNNGTNGNTGTDLTQLPDDIIVTFNNYNNNPPGTPGASLTAYATNGVFPAAPVTAENNMAPSGIDLNSGHLFSATLTYNGGTLTESLTDTVTGANYTHQYAANIPAAITGDTAFIGFGGGTGLATDDVYIHSWTYTAGSSSSGTPGSSTPATPVFSPASGTYTLPQSVNISDATGGTSVYYTTDGSTPTASSAKYSGAISVNSTQTVKAVAIGSISSAIGSATYTMSSSSQAKAATPELAPSSGTYTSAQSVSISDSTPNSTIYYTTNGSAPGTSSTKYTGPVTVSSTETLQAVAVASGDAVSNVASATYTINGGAGGGGSASPSTVINYPGGFSGSAGAIVPINNASFSGSAIQLTSSAANQDSQVYFKTPVNVQAFSTSFTWTAKCPTSGTSCGDGMGFVIISGTNPKSPAYWSGGSGGSLGWATDCTQSGADCEHLNSVLVKFDLYNVSTSSGTANLTGIYTGGQYPQPPNAEYDMSHSGINMQSGHLMRATLTYNGSTLYETVTDTVTNGTYTNSYSVNIPAQIGSNVAVVGFSGASGAAAVQQDIMSWTYTVQTPEAAAAASAVAAPSFSPAAGIYSSPQSVAISDANPSAVLYYTTNGGMPTTSSAKYTGPIAVNSTETLKAIAILGNAGSEVAPASYTINGSSGTGSTNTVINYPDGFGNAAGTIETVNAAFDSGSSIQLTGLKEYEAGNVYFKTPVDVQAFSTSFTWTAKCPGAAGNCGDGMGFVIMSTTNPKSPSYWSGGTGIDLSWSDDCTSSGGDCQPLNSVLVKFGLYNSVTGSHAANLTGLYAGGQLPMPPNPQYDMAPSGINMQSGHLMRSTLTYNGTTLYETVTDTATNNTYTNHYTVDIPSVVRGNTALVGFAGATGTAVVQQNIEGWVYTVQQ